MKVWPVFLLSTTLAHAEPMRIVRLDPRFEALVPHDAVLEKIADGQVWVEGPVWNRAGGFLLFSDIPQNSIFKWKAGNGVSLFLKPSGYTGTAPFAGREPGSNALTYDPQGRLVLCQHGDRRIVRVEKDGAWTTLVDRYDGKRINSPNDAVFRSNGDLYFTDPPFGLPKAFDDPARELDFCGVYRLSAVAAGDDRGAAEKGRPQRGRLQLLTKEVKAPNGIAFSPDEKTLYVTDVDPDRPAWLAFDVGEDGMIANGRVFFDARPFTRKFKGAPDGLKVDKQGNIFGAGPGGVYVFAADGTHLGTMELGVPTSNCNWGEDGASLFITADTAIYRIRLSTSGIYP
jgi:gluconolactonase